MSQALEAGKQAHTNATIPTLSVTAGKDCVVEGLVNGVPTSILLDTGAAMSVLSKTTWEKSGGELREVTGRRLVGVQGDLLQLYGSVWVKVLLATEMFCADVVVAETPTADLIIGRDFLHAYECTIEMSEGGDTLHVRSRGLKLPILKAQPEPSMSFCLNLSKFPHVVKWR